MKDTEILTPRLSNLLIEDIIVFCKNYNIYLSSEYANFLLKYNESTVNSKRILIRRLLESGFIQEFYLGGFLSFKEFQESYLYFYKENTEDELIEASVAIIGQTNGRTSICIGIGQNNSGQIFLWDGDFGVTKQADSLQAFFNSLVIDQNQS